MKLLSKLTLLAASMVLVGGLVSPVAFAEGDCPDTLSKDTLTLKNGVSCSKTAEQQTSLFGAGSVFETVSRVLIFLVGAISVIMLIFGGIRYTVSGGDKTAVESAKNTIMYAIIGIIVALLAYAVVAFVVNSLAASA